MIGGLCRLFNDIGAKKQGCKNTAPKNFNHIFIEKPVTNFHNLEITLIYKLANAIFFLVNVPKTPLHDSVRSDYLPENRPQDKFVEMKNGGKNTAVVIILTISYEKPEPKIGWFLCLATLFP